MKKNNARSALGPVSIRRYITPILILLSVMDGSIFFERKLCRSFISLFSSLLQTELCIEAKFFEGKELTLKYFVYFCCIVLKQLKNSIL